MKTDYDVLRAKLLMADGETVCVVSGCDGNTKDWCMFNTWYVLVTYMPGGTRFDNEVIHGPFQDVMAAANFLWETYGYDYGRR